MNVPIDHRRVHPIVRGVAWSVLAAVVVVSLLGPLTALAHPPGITTRVSVDSAGNESNFISEDAAITPDGRFVAFASQASNLVPGDTNNVSDIFVHDRLTGTTERVSVDSRGREGNDNSGIVGFANKPSISADGRFVAFRSDASNLVKGDNNGASDIFVHDRLTGTTERVSVDSQGHEANGFSDSPAISDDGRFVAFLSGASNLVPNDGNFAIDIFVHDRLMGTTERVSVSSLGAEANSDSFLPAISADGRFVAFDSGAENLVPGPSSSSFQVFIHDRQSGTTERVSQDAAGNPGDFNSARASLSADGRFVAFETSASNLLPGGQNSSGQVLVFDRQTGTMELVSVNSAGVAANDLSVGAAISSDGRFVAFSSFASNLAEGDTNGRMDVFVRDRQAGTTIQASVNTTGVEGESESILPSISADGQVVAFQSNSTNLVPDKTTSFTDIFVHDDRPAADLAVTKSDTPDPVRKGQDLTYTVVVTNNGPAQATGVTLTDTLPAQVSFLSATPSTGSCTAANGIITCSLGVLNNGASATVTIVVKPKQVGTITNTARVSSLPPDPTPSDNTATADTTVTLH